MTVSGRAAATLVPPGRRSWRRHAELADLFAGPEVPTWAKDREQLDAVIRDPWTTGN